MVRRPIPGDPLLSALEVGLGVALLFAPLPFGSVRPPGRTVLEVVCLALLAIWTVRSALRGCVAPPRVAWIAATGLIALALLQVVPFGDAVVGGVSPTATALRDAATRSDEVRRVEEEILGLDPRSLDATATLSLAPDSTLEALRTGVSLFALWLVSFTVATERSFRRLGIVILAAAAFQSLYGILVVASGFDRIWNVPKEYFLDCATGTFVNRNHYAHLVAVGATIGTAWTLDAMRRRAGTRTARGIAAWLRNDAIEVWVLGGMTVVSFAGLLVSFSRAGTALGAAGVLAVLGAAAGFGRRARLALIVALVLVAVVPLARIGPDRLLERYANTVDQLRAPMSRPQVWLDTIEMAGAFPWLGSGFGTFAEVYPAFRSPEIRHRFDHAHSDLLQVAAEGGIVGLALALALLFPHALAARRAIVGRAGIAGLGLAAALGVALAHALVDFPMHIPATAAFDAAVAGALLGTVWSRGN